MKASGRTYDPTSSSDAPDGRSPSDDASRPSVHDALPARRFGLDGPTVPLDPRRHAFRADIADIALAGRVIASHYAEPLVRNCTADADVRAETDAAPSATLRMGEAFAVLDCSRGLAWGYRIDDHLVGYVDEAKLSDA